MTEDEEEEEWREKFKQRAHDERVHRQGKGFASCGKVEMDVGLWSVGRETRMLEYLFTQVLTRCSKLIFTKHTRVDVRFCC